MKKLLIALALSSTVLLSGCGIFRSDQAWKSAKQENPLEIPPGLDHPSATDALTIPTVNGQADASAAAATPPVTGSPTSLALADDVDSAYRRVGLALERGDIGTVSSQDEATHTFQVRVKGQAGIEQKQGFFQRHFSNTQPNQEVTQEQSSGGGKSAPMIAIRVAPGDNGGSVVSAQGNAEQAARVISALKARLGG